MLSVSSSPPVILKRRSTFGRLLRPASVREADDGLRIRRSQSHHFRTPPDTRTAAAKRKIFCPKTGLGGVGDLLDLDGELPGVALHRDFSDVRTIGNGSFSRVYAAKNRKDDREYAVKKILRPLSRRLCEELQRTSEKQESTPSTENSPDKEDMDGGPVTRVNNKARDTIVSNSRGRAAQERQRPAAFAETSDDDSGQLAGESRYPLHQLFIPRCTSESAFEGALSSCSPAGEARGTGGTSEEQLHRHDGMKECEARAEEEDEHTVEPGQGCTTPSPSRLTSPGIAGYAHKKKQGAGLREEEDATSFGSRGILVPQLPSLLSSCSSPLSVGDDASESDGRDGLELGKIQMQKKMVVAEDADKGGHGGLPGLLLPRVLDYDDTPVSTSPDHGRGEAGGQAQAAAETSSVNVCVVDQDEDTIVRSDRRNRMISSHTEMEEEHQEEEKGVPATSAQLLARPGSLYLRNRTARHRSSTCDTLNTEDVQREGSTAALQLLGENQIKREKNDPTGLSSSTQQLYCGGRRQAVGVAEESLLLIPEAQAAITTIPTDVLEANRDTSGATVRRSRDTPLIAIPPVIPEETPWELDSEREQGYPENTPRVDEAGRRRQSFMSNRFVATPSPTSAQIKGANTCSRLGEGRFTDVLVPTTSAVSDRRGRETASLTSGIGNAKNTVSTAAGSSIFVSCDNRSASPAVCETPRLSSSTANSDTSPRSGCALYNDSRTVRGRISVVSRASCAAGSPPSRSPTEAGRGPRERATTDSLSGPLAEVRILAVVGRDCKNIVQYHFCWIEDLKLHIQLELCTGSLKSLVRERRVENTLLQLEDARKNGGRRGTGNLRLRCLNDAEITRVLADIGRALCFLHDDKGFVHFDVKPDNIFYQRGDEQTREQAGAGGAHTFTFKLGDFGLCKSMRSLEASVGATEELLRTEVPRLASPPAPFGYDITQGDCRYLAPELMGKWDLREVPKVDVFALGVSVYEMAVGTLELEDASAGSRGRVNVHDKKLWKPGEPLHDAKAEQDEDEGQAEVENDQSKSRRGTAGSGGTAESSRALAFLLTEGKMNSFALFELFRAMVAVKPAARPRSAEVLAKAEGVMKKMVGIYFGNGIGTIPPAAVKVTKNTNSRDHDEDKNVDSGGRRRDSIS